MTHILLHCVVSCFCLVCVTSEVTMEAFFQRKLPFTYEQFYQVKDDKTLINSVVDFVLADLALRYENNITVPDHKWSYSLAGLKINLSSGKLLGLSSLRRVGDLEVDVREKRMKVSLTVTFEELSFAYDEYVAQYLWWLTNSGRLNIYVLDNLIRMTVIMEKKSLCLLDVNKVEILQLDNIKLEFHSSCSLCNTISGYISTKVLNLYVDSIKHMIQTQIDKTIKDFVRANHGINLICLNKRYLERLRSEAKAKRRRK